jgi:hypothetical protein
MQGEANHNTKNNVSFNGMNNIAKKIKFDNNKKKL